jgi:FKBP-type peptidyl-prolyl cis-trans isomerase FklB
LIFKDIVGFDMKTKLIFLLCSGLLSMSALAEEVIVIDTQSISEQAASQPRSEAPAVEAPSEAAEPPPDLRRPFDATDYVPDRDAIRKSGHMSRRQQMWIERADTADNNLKEGEDFLEENKTKPGVVSLPSGAQYKILRAGTGMKPNEFSLVTFRYRGTLTDGTVFEDRSDPRSYRNEYVSSMVIAGWQELVPMMQAGSKWQFFLPAKLAFKEFGNRDKVKPNMAVIYEFELMVVKQ